MDVFLQPALTSKKQLNRLGPGTIINTSSRLQLVGKVVSVFHLAGATGLDDGTTVDLIEQITLPSTFMLTLRLLSLIRILWKTFCDVWESNQCHAASSGAEITRLFRGET